jgi:prevent-host-death family protein
LTSTLLIYTIALSGYCNLKEVLMTIHVSIGKVKRDISELVNRVAYQGERIVLTSRGRPKAVLISIEDFERLQQAEQKSGGRSAWLERAQALAEQIRLRRGERDIDVNALIEADHMERDSRDG